LPKPMSPDSWRRLLLRLPAKGSGGAILHLDAGAATNLRPAGAFP
jgi:hypothetical protein